MNVTAELKRAYFPGFTPEAQEALLSYDWPGNVRELKNAVERSIYRWPDPDAPVARIELDPFASPFRLASAETPAAEMQQQIPTPERPARRLPVDLKEAVRAFEREYLEAALEQARYNRRAAARLLGLTYDQLRGCLRKHGITAGS